MQSNTKTPRVLITGGLGHIGSRLIEGFNCDFTVADDLSTERYCSLFRYGQPINQLIRFIPRCFGNLTEDELSKFDVIIHLAAKTNAAASFKNRDEMERVNVNQTSDFIIRSSNAGVGLFVFPSSTSVYGVAKDVVTEDDPGCINPQSPYAESKIKIEEALQDSSMPHIIFRFGTIFGISPGMRFHTAVNKFCFQASVGEPLTVWKQNLHQKRPYLGLGDAIHAIKLAVLEEYQYPLHHNQQYNVISGNYTVDDVISIIRTHRDVEIDLVDTPLLNQFSYEVSCNKIKDVGYTPKESIEDGIDSTMKLLSRITPS